MVCFWILCLASWSVTTAIFLPSHRYLVVNESRALENSINNVTQQSNVGTFHRNDLLGDRLKISAKAREDELSSAGKKLWMGLGSAAVSLDWSALREQVAGYSVSVGKSHWTVLGEHHSHTLPALRTNSLYEATLTPVSSSGRHHTSHHIDFNTPTFLSDDKVNEVMQEHRESNCSGALRINQISLSLKLEGVDTEGMVLEVADLLTSKPLQWVDLTKDSRVVFLTGLEPGKFLNLTVKQMLSSEPLISQDLLSKALVTGGCLFPASTSANLTRTLDLFFPTKSSSSNKWQVRCYADDEVFTGFPCRNSDICVPINWMCDSEDDCPDGDDEDRCGGGANHYHNSYCRKTEFRCLRRREHVCLPISWLCDGRRDCSDGWDEEPRNCRGYYGRPGGLHYGGGSGAACRDSYFRCRNGLGCIAAKFLCDGEDDCADSSDEWNCTNDYDCDPYKEFQCFKSWGRERCIPRTWVCDDQDDCEKGEDEDFDICRRVL